jgi:thioredoxin 2
MSIFRCPSCGQMNRLPESAATGVARCGRCQAALARDGEPQAVGEAAFDEAIRAAPVPVLVDFWAPWCGPCRTAAPMLDAIGRARAGELLVLKVNTDENPGLAARYGIRSIPSFFVFRGGELVAQQAGLPPRPAFERWLDGAIASTRGAA